MVRHLASQMNGQVSDLNYRDRVSCVLAVPEDMSSELIDRLQWLWCAYI